VRIGVGGAGELFGALRRARRRRGGRVEAEHKDNSFPSNDYSGSDNVFGWQVIGGARVQAFDGPVRLFLEYRYQKARNAEIEGHTVAYNSRSLTFGARWTF